MRRLLTLLLASLLLLTACSRGNGGGEETPAAPTVSAVKVSGKAGEAPEVSGVKGITTKEVVSAVATEGDGDKLAKGDTVNLSYLLFTAKDGKQVTSTYDAESPVGLTLEPDKDRLMAASMVGKTVGSRLVIAAPAVEFYGEENLEQAGASKDETLVLVTELVSKFAEPKPNGSIKDVSVSGAYGKEPTVKVKKKLFVAKTESKDLKAGKGAAIKEGDTVSVNYHGVDARTGEMFDSSYANGSAVDLTLASDQVIAGFVKGLVGKKLGSRVLITIPYTDAYGTTGSPDVGIEGGDSLIFVVDLIKKK